MFKRILLPLDGSALAEQALEMAVQLSRTAQAEIYLLRVVTPLAKSYRAGSSSISAIETAEDMLKQMARDYLADIADRLKQEGVTVQAAVHTGTPYREIARFVEKNKIDLIVMASRGETGLTRWLLGSVTDNVVRGVKTPVLVVPAQSEAAASAAPGESAAR